jgi:hypothetical protein
MFRPVMAVLREVRIHVFVFFILNLSEDDHDRSKHVGSQHMYINHLQNICVHLCLLGTLSI